MRVFLTRDRTSSGAPAGERSPAGLRSLRSLTAPLRGAVSLRGKGSLRLSRRQRGAGVWAPGDRGSTGLLGAFHAPCPTELVCLRELREGGVVADSFMADGPRLLVLLGSSWPSSGAPTPMSCGCHSEIRERPRRQAGALSFAPHGFSRYAQLTPFCPSISTRDNSSAAVSATYVFSCGGGGDSTLERMRQ